MNNSISHSNQSNTSDKWLNYIIIFTLFINALSLFVPILRNDDPALYANIAKHMVQSHNLIDLISRGHDWLDKPHLPFWLTAISFEIFGINSFAYILPGFIFHLIGAYYTYRLTNLLYNKFTAKLAIIIYLSAFHLLLSSVDVRAEAYLLGEIMPACFYLYRYISTTLINKLGEKGNNKIYHFDLLYIAFFTALALMTKGLFVLITIYSGVVVVTIFNRKLRVISLSKWLLLAVLVGIFILPEILSLYYQFDLHPEKVIFNHTHVSGVKWFFWGSQFGRFFNDGAIVTSHVYPWHYLFFVHTFMWAFLPWSLVFIVAFIYGAWFCVSNKQSIYDKSINLTKVVSEKTKMLYLLSSFLGTFIVFSISRFQLDYYTDIIMPFAAIICARWLFAQLDQNGVMKVNRGIWLLNFQQWLGILLTVIAICISCIVFWQHKLIIEIVVVGAIVILVIVLLWHQHLFRRSIIYSVFGVSSVFCAALLINVKVYAKYDLGYAASHYLDIKPRLPVVDYMANSLTLEFYAKTPYKYVDNLHKLNEFKQAAFYIVMPESKMPELKHYLSLNLKINQTKPEIKVVHTISATTIDKVMQNLFHLSTLNKVLVKYVIILVRT